MDMEAVFRAFLALPSDWTRLSPGEQLRSLREARGMSQNHLAKDSRVDQGLISRLERGHADARWEVWERLFAALGYLAVIAPHPSSDDAEDLIEDGVLARKDRAELGRAKRWG